MDAPPIAPWAPTTPNPEAFQDDLYFSNERVTVAVTAMFLITFILSNILHSFHVTFIPESFVVILMGAALGFFMNYTSVVEGISLEQDIFLNRNILSLLLLPIIIFEAGWSLRHKDFFSQLPYILLFAVVGTVISAGVVAGLILWTSDVHGISQPRVALAYAALISAVDPVATLSTYAHLQVEPLLNVLVLGESIVNDAVAIVLFETLNQPAAHTFREKSAGRAVLEVAGGVAGLLFGSAGLGLALGVFYVLLLRFTRMRCSPALQILFVTMTCFFTYAFTEEVCSMSPIIAVLFCSILMSATATPHLGLEGNMLTAFFLKQLASLADMAVFMFVGIAVAFQTSEGWKFGCLLMPFCLLGRLAAVVPLGLLANGIKAAAGKELEREQRLLLSWRHLFMMWHAGLRGGIALVLTLQLEEWVDEIDGPGTKDVLRNGTVSIICCFLLVFGGSTEFFLKVLGVPTGGSQKMYHHRGRCLRTGLWLRDRVLRPLLVGRALTELQMHGGVITGFMQKAQKAHMAPGAGEEEPVAREVSREERIARACTTFDLFGSDDPMQLEQATSEAGSDLAEEHEHELWTLAAESSSSGED